MSSEPPAFATVDHGTASIAVSLVGSVGGHWRLLGTTAGPAAIGADPLLERLAGRLADADPGLARGCGVAAPGSAARLSRLVTRTTEPPVLLVVAATNRVVAPLAAVAATAGWRVRTIAIDGANILAVAAALADPAVTAVLAGASDPPGADERPLVPELGTLLAGATQRRPDLVVILAGGIGERNGPTHTLIARDRPGVTLLAPAAATGGGAALAAQLDGLREAPEDGRRAAAATAGTLAEVLQRRVEVVDIGRSSGSRIAASWPPGGPAVVRSATVADAALLPPGVEGGVADGVVDAVMGWLTSPLDRLRARDRLRELALVPWGDAAGDGALLRMAAGRAALARLLAATPEFDALPAPDLLVASGGAWAVAPGPAVALALADMVRRPGIRALGLDHARLLGPLGTIVDPAERRAVIADLRDELLVPLGSVAIASGLRGGRSAGRLVVHGSAGPAELDLVPGGLELVDLPPGERAVVELQFGEEVDLGLRARHFATEVTGGLGGFLVDLRDVPLRLPDRLDRRRDLLVAWQGALWAGLDA